MCLVLVVSSDATDHCHVSMEQAIIKQYVPHYQTTANGDRLLGKLTPGKRVPKLLISSTLVTQLLHVCNSLYNRDID